MCGSCSRPLVCPTRHDHGDREQSPGTRRTVPQADTYTATRHDLVRATSPAPGPHRPPSSARSPPVRRPRPLIQPVMRTVYSPHYLPFTTVTKIVDDTGTPFAIIVKFAADQDQTIASASSFEEFALLSPAFATTGAGRTKARYISSRRFRPDTTVVDRGNGIIPSDPPVGLRTSCREWLPLQVLRGTSIRRFCSQRFRSSLTDTSASHG